MKKEIDVVKQLEQKKYHKNYVPIIVVSIFLLFIIDFFTFLGYIIYV